MSEHMTASSTSASARGLSGWHVLAAMIAFFAVIIAVDTTMIYKALSTFGGVDDDNAYRDGLTYNTRIASAEKQAVLGWQDKVEVLSNPAKLRVSFHDNAGQPVAGLRVETRLARPATTRFDAIFPMSEVAPGVFETAVAQDDGAGAWVADIRATRAGETSPAYQARRRIWRTP